MARIELSIFNPRWGHDDTYTVELERDFMEVTMNAREARADWRDNADPVWSGDSLQDIMQNDNVYPPATPQDLFEKVWTPWRAGELNDQQAEAELQAVAEWLNVVTQAKPRTDFWRTYF